MGIVPVAVYSEADATALHVMLADVAVCLGPPPAVDSYLNIPAIIAAARTAGADAVHPGYGFLSENATFAEACLAAGLTWVGPPPAAMRAMGSKIAAKQLAARLGVPLLPGYQGAEQDDSLLARQAEEIGYPLLIKASAGGGGRGMRVVTAPADFGAALAAARREALAAFGDDAVLLERYVARPRHIEIQVFGDAHGNIIHLGERECSIQRRHQKVIEEAPSPALTPALRREMGAAAVRLARSIGYTGAGTVEFLLDETGRFAFLEMNTRLQVEHGVTELVTGLDLVQLQLRVATGAPLGLQQEDVVLRGHAIQCRLYAEDPARDYLPAAGLLERFVLPAAGARVDAAYYEGAEVTSYYDAMLAKLLVHGADRAEAIARMAAVLDRCDIEGIATNLPLLRATITHPAFAAGETHTGFLDQHVLSALAPRFPEEALLGAAAFELTAPVDAPDPWLAGPWRMSGAGLTLRYQVNGADYTVTAHRRASGAWDLDIAGRKYADLQIVRPAPARLLVRAGTEVHGFTAERAGEGLRVTGRGASAVVLRQPPPDVAHTGHRHGTGGGARTLTAPLTGVVVRVLAAEGDEVRARQPLMILEAMKMEHTIAAPADGVLRRVHCQPGDRVQAGDLLAALE